MVRDENEDKTTYKVVLNHEEQYSIWPADRENAPGWRDAGKNGCKQECLAWIKEVWTDMRPLSLRKRMEEAAAGRCVDRGGPHHAALEGLAWPREEAGPRRRRAVHGAGGRSRRRTAVDRPAAGGAGAQHPEGRASVVEGA
jgi:MbtH protein